MTDFRDVVCLSEYGTSYMCVDSCRNDYYDRLQFRIKRRSSEYSHHPFIWDDLEDLKSSLPEPSLREDIKVDKNDILGKACLDSEKGHSENLTEAPLISEGPYAVKYGARENSDNIPNNTADTGTQTQKASLQKAIKQPKAFVPYAIGSSPAPMSGARRTFNVKSDKDVYPSAVRAEARRKERLISFAHRNALNFKVPSEVYGPKRCIEKSGTSKLDKTEKHAPVLCESTARVNRLNSSNSRSNNHTIWKQTNSWVSEYTQKYSSYPSSVYVRGASLAASRSRPLRFSYSRPPSSFLESLVPSTPVLLSCRGSNPAFKSRRETHCDMCYAADLNRRYTRPLLSAH
uniref:SJCHGC02340 protein n=1 Tax=Schistosoma japonicum TaxID=6182 RepID=Q5D9B8_SCHJA|nr:SJCHGC02340 protein [Schistosoma japonicum]